MRSGRQGNHAQLTEHGVECRGKITDRVDHSAVEVDDRGTGGPMVEANRVQNKQIEFKKSAWYSTVHEEIKFETASGVNGAATHHALLTTGRKNMVELLLPLAEPAPVTSESGQKRKFALELRFVFTLSLMQVSA